MTTPIPTATTTTATTHAETFRRLHGGPSVLLLPNCDHAGNARLIESLGAPALATTSAGVAWMHGYRDGDALPIELVIATVASIARVIRVPLTVDLEGGYADDPGAVAALVARVVEAGGVGINLEDGGGPPERLAAKVARVKRELGDRVFVNARTDVFLRGLGAAEGRVAESIARGTRYLDAGADGFFVPKALAPDDIRAIAAAVPLPLNLLAWPGLPPAAELGALGARRVTAGSGFVQRAASHTAQLARAFLRDGQLPLQGEGGLNHADLNALFA